MSTINAPVINVAGSTDGSQRDLLAPAPGAQRGEVVGQCAGHAVGNRQREQDADDAAPTSA